MALMTSTNAGFTIDETISAFAFDEFVQESAVMPLVFDQQGSSGYREVTASMSALDEFAVKTEGANPDEDFPLQQFKKEFEMQRLGLMIKIDEDIISDARFDVFGQFGRKLGESSIRTFETRAATVFNDAFAGGTYSVESGLSMCNGAHVNAASGNSQSNTGTLSLTYDNIGTTITSMKRFKGYRGEEVHVNPDTLLIPDEKEQIAWEAIQSPGDPTEANLKANFYRGKFTIIPWSYLSRNDDDNWFMLDSRMAKQNLKWFWRLPLTIFGDGDAFKSIRRVGGAFREQHGPIDWRFVFGHNAAT